MLGRVQLEHADTHDAGEGAQFVTRRPRGRAAAPLSNSRASGGTAEPRHRCPPTRRRRLCSTIDFPSSLVRKLGAQPSPPDLTLPHLPTLHSHSSLITAIKTPYLPNGKIDLDAYDELVRRQCVAGVDGLVVGGTTGEGQLMSWDEHVMLIAHTVNSFGGKGECVGVCALCAVHVCVVSPHPDSPFFNLFFLTLFFPSRQNPRHRQHGVQRHPGSSARHGARVRGGHGGRPADQPVLW